MSYSKSALRGEATAPTLEMMALTPSLLLVLLTQPLLLSTFLSTQTFDVLGPNLLP